MKEIPVYGLKDFFNDVKSEFNEHSSNFSVFDTANAPDLLRGSNPFRNDSYCMVFIIEGGIDITIDFNTHTLEKDSVFFVTPGQVCSSVDRIQQGFGVMFQEEFLGSTKTTNWLKSLPIFHRFHSAPFLQFKNKSFEPIIRRLELLLFEYQGINNYKYDAIRAHLILIIIELSRIYSLKKGEFKKKESHQILRLESLINEQYEQMRSVKEYAEQMYMSPQNLNRITKSITGKSVSELINEKLLIEIKRNLIYTDKSSEEIAFQLNFYDNSYFTKYFKKTVGVTPREFREVHKKV